jgi:hypothetical protein
MMRVRNRLERRRSKKLPARERGESPLPSPFAYGTNLVMKDCDTARAALCNAQKEEDRAREAREAKERERERERERKRERKRERGRERERGIERERRERERERGNGAEKERSKIELGEHGIDSSYLNGILVRIFVTRENFCCLNT